MPNDTNSWLWWFLSGVVITTIVNIMSTFLKEKIDRLWGKFSEDKRMKNIKYQQEIESYLNKIFHDQNEINYVFNRLLVFRISAYAQFTVALILVTESIQFNLPADNSKYIIFILAAFLMTFLFNNNIKKSKFYSDIIKAYRQRKDDGEKES